MQSSRAKKIKMLEVEECQSTTKNSTVAVTVEQHYLTNAVLGNDLIFSAIASYLGTSDLKNLRQTCKLLLNKINSHRSFFSCLKIKINDEEIEANMIEPEPTINVNVANIVVNSTAPHYMSSVVKSRLRDVIDLKLSYSDNQDVSAEHYPCAESLGECYRCLPSFSNLRSLTIGLKLFCYDVPITALVPLVDKIKDLQLRGERIKTMELKTSKFYQRNMEYIGSLGWSLKSFAFILRAVTPAYIHASSMEKILLSSGETLENIHVDPAGINDDYIDVFGLEHVGKIQNIAFPSLKAIRLPITSEAVFALFLAKQPPLESIQLHGNSVFEPLIILNAIIAHCDGPNSKLHTLELGGYASLSGTHHRFSWAFLKGLKNLKNFRCGWSLVDPFCFDNRDLLLDFLPDTIRLLEMVSHLGQLDPLVLDGSVDAIPVFNRFQHLRVLKITRCGFGLTDSLLQSVCGSLTLLRALHFGCSKHITNFGLTGERMNPATNTGVSLRNLKGLQELEIINCSKVTCEGLIKSIEFHELRVAKLDYNIPDADLVQIVSNNPSLEFVAIGQCFPVPSSAFSDLFSRITEVNSKITRVHKEFVSKGSNFLSVEGRRQPSTGLVSIRSPKERTRSIFSKGYPMF